PGLPPRAPPVDVARESVHRPAGPVEREHQVHAEPLAEREAVDEPLQLRHHFVAGAELELGCEKPLESTGMHLLEVPDLLLREGLVPNVDERRAPPEAERRLEDGYLLPRGLRIRPCDQMLESHGVELARVDLEDVA